VFLTATVLAVAYLGFYSPLSSQFDRSRQEFDAQLRRFVVISDIERLREQYKLFKGRLSPKPDANEWVHYLLDGVRQYPLKVLMLDPDKVRDVGPYKAVVLRVDLEGSLADIHKFINWLETNERLIRIDALSIQPIRNKNGALMASFTIVGMMG
jgi:hypothetical protein